MDHDRRNLTVDVGVDNSLHKRSVFHATETFVVDDDIEVIDPITLFVDVGFDFPLAPVLQNRPLDLTNARC